MKKRVDLVLQERGIVVSREAARTAIMDGAVLVDGTKVTKPGMLIREDSVIELTGSWREVKKYVSRGGLKLEKALNEFNVCVADRTCLDVGASTGGFTDCLLQFGACTVYAVDVGYGQLDWALRNDPRVIVKERVNARNLTADALYVEGAQAATLVVMDISFISILKVLPAVLTCSALEAEVIALVKPQFEAGAQHVGKGGVVRSAETHESVLRTVLQGAHDAGLSLSGLTYSPLTGPAGNIEFLAYWRRSGSGEQATVDVRAVVTEAHAVLL